MNVAVQLAVPFWPWWFLDDSEQFRMNSDEVQDYSKSFDVFVATLLGC
jgi:hypothetical protein